MAVQRTTGRSDGYYRQRDSRRYTTTYIDGNVVRHIQMAPERDVPAAPRRRTSVKTRRNRERALYISMSYVVFLTAASVAAVFLCVQYLQLQAQGTTYRSEIAALESTLNTARLANDNAYEEAMSSVDLGRIKEIAVNELGMVYAGEGQVITYNSQAEDYVRQYQEIPAQQ